MIMSGAVPPAVGVREWNFCPVPAAALSLVMRKPLFVVEPSIQPCTVVIKLACAFESKMALAATTALMVVVATELKKFHPPPLHVGLAQVAPLPALPQAVPAMPVTEPELPVPSFHAEITGHKVSVPAVCANV